MQEQKTLNRSMLQIAGLLLANPSNPASAAWSLIFYPWSLAPAMGLSVSQCPALARCGYTFSNLKDLG